MTKHTPAPWLIENGEHSIWVYVNADSHKKYKVISAMSTLQSSSLADAKLIAAAPEMLEALQAALKLSDDCMDADKATGYERERSPECEAVYNQVKAAIEKATI